MEHPEIRGLSEWRPLASGACADIWEARQQSLDRLVAVKVYRAGLDEAGRRRFLREAAAAGRLPYHPSIVTAHGAGRLPDDRPYLILELFSGGSLTAWLTPGNRVREERVRQVGVRIADALAAVHASGVLHRDIRPDNILLHGTGQPGLMDFGSAAVGGAAAEAEPGAGPVTSVYAPPEASGGQRATEFGDVYALASTLTALLAGHPPSGQGLARLLVPSGGFLVDTLLPALSEDPRERPTAARLRDQLSRAVREEAPRPRPPVVVTGVRRPAVDPVATPVAAAVAVEPLGDQLSPRDEPRSRDRRRLGVVVVAAAAVTLVGASSVWLARGSTPGSAPVVAGPSATAEPSRSAEPGTPSGGPSSAEPSTSTTAGAAQPDGSGGDSEHAIRLQQSTDVAKPFQTVRIQGRYEGGASRFVRVQRWEAGRWQAFPLPTKTDPSGQLTAFVELGQPGRHRIRVLDPDSGVTSDPVVLVIRA